MQLETQIAKAASRGLHDTAQPLTVLQGLLELALEQARTTEDYRKALTAALSETARVTACFENVRQLVRLQQPAPDVCAFSISQALQDVLGETRTAEVEFTTATELLVYGSQGRVRQALSLLISAVALNALDEVEILVDAQPLSVEVRLSVSGETDLLSSNLEMPQLIAASTGGEIRFCETFDAVSLLLPRAAVQPTDKKGMLTHV
jgi:signal transduction histidine kinase